MTFESFKPKAPLDATSTPAKKPKLRSMAPPGEAEATGAERGRKASRARAKAKKEAAAKKTPAKTKASGTNASGGSVRSGGAMAEKAGVTKKAIPAKPKPTSITSAILSGPETGIGIEALRKKLQKQKVSVLVRPTTRTANYRQRAVGPNLTPKKAEKAIELMFGKPIETFRVMDLPKELRAMIWRHAVVYENCLIDPGDSFGREQPDLAMTCRQVRAEVLPIFYGENIFAIDVSHKTPEFSVPIDRILNTWGALLQGSGDKPGPFSMIRKWAFKYSPSFIEVMTGASQQFIVIVTFSKKQVGGGIFWNANIEVHRNALCIIPLSPEFGLCNVKTVPEWLNEPVIAVTEAAKGGHITLDMMRELIMKIKSEATRTEMYRCEAMFASSPEPALQQAPAPINQSGNSGAGMSTMGNIWLS